MVIAKKDFEAIRQIGKEGVFYLNLSLYPKPIKVQKQKNLAVLEDSFRIDLNEELKDNFLYLIDKQEVIKIALFSSQTNRFYKLIPTPDWPTIAIGSVPMHRLSSPKKDTENKIELIKPSGLVLDTCMGLGYTATLASKTANKVITFEKDENILALAKLNPLSGKLFSAKSIEIRNEDVSIGIRDLKDSSFDCIIHDPPTFKLAGELFSGDFYCELKRVLKNNSKLFHYTPLYKIKQGFDFPASVKKRLRKVGFKDITYSQGAGGFLCRK